MGRPATDKRERLVNAACERFHRKGYAGTSLSDVAQAAGVPTGNVFYYFKTKADLARAVIDEWCHLLAGYLAILEPERGPWQRLEAFVEQARIMRVTYVTLGCPLAGLTRDLQQEGDDLKSEAVRIYAVQFAWLAAQFVFCGFSPADAAEHSRNVMTRYHGAILLAHAQNDDSMIEREVTSLKTWLGEIRDGLRESSCTTDRDSQVG